jgi:ABC-type transport system involved in multi-copper enzyme maturation permease subunit
MISNSNIRSLAALFKKDFLVIPYSRITVYIVVLILASADISVSFLLAIFLMAASLSYDEKSKIDTMLCSLPVKRTDIVFAKYLNTWIIFLVLAIIPFLAAPLWRMVFPGSSEFNLRIEYIYYPLVIMFNACAIFFPAHFKFIGRFDKSILSFVIAASVIAIFITVVITTLLLFQDMVYKPLFHVGLFWGMIVFNALSISISNYVYKRQELAI